MKHKTSPELTTWKPLISVGPFVLGTPVNNYEDRYRFEKIEDDEDDWEGYRFSEADMCVYTEDGKIILITCYQELRFKGQNLLDLSLKQACELLGTEPDEIEGPFYLSDGACDTADFSSLGVELWVRDDRVLFASVYEYIEE